MTTVRLPDGTVARRAGAAGDGVTVGVRVVTMFSGRPTAHRVTAERARQVSQSGRLVQVSPEVPKSGGPEAWLDAGWFAVLEEVP